MKKEYEDIINTLDEELDERYDHIEKYGLEAGVDYCLSILRRVLEKDGE